MTNEANTPAPTSHEIRVAGDPPSNTAPVTKQPAGKAKGVNKSKATGAKAKKAPAPKVTKTSTFTSVELAVEHKMSPKTLRARIRRNIEKWEPLFKDGEKHVFADNKTIRAKIEALLS